MRMGVGVMAGMCAAIAACGGQSGGNGVGNDASASSETAATAADPCSLVTPEEVAAIIGEKVTGAAPGESSCKYETEDAMASSVTIDLKQGDAAGEMDVARKAAGVLKDIGGSVADKGGAGADVNAALSESGDTPRIGNEAFFGPNQQLSVRKGDSYIAVSPPMMRSRMSGGNPLLSTDEKKKMATAIAQKAVTRLP